MITRPERHRPHILDEELFRHILVGERRRSDRSNKPLLVMTIAGDLPSGDASLIWRDALDAVSAQTRGTDVVGWLDRRATIGVVLHDVAAADAAQPRDLEIRLRREFARHFTAETVARFSIRLHVHHPFEHADAPEVEPADSAAFQEVRRSRRRQAAYDGFKRSFDIAGSLSLLILLAPLFLIIAALVKLRSPGPVLFHQERVGRKMKPFKMLKFRTMHANADPALHQQFVRQFIKSSQPAGDGVTTGGVFKLTADPRITPIGHLLRKTSLDELPQFWNVLRGEMSLVGPRPALPYEVEQYQAWHTRRVIEAKPGITGLWQVGGRSRTTFDEMVRLDLRYARNRSLWTDFKILLATPGAVFSGKGAY
jgi:exopolysaccharide biosynthesis polyprenyl glycosylphosphotransferase